LVLVNCDFQKSLLSTLSFLAGVNNCFDGTNKSLTAKSSATILPHLALRPSYREA
jgi:hypothetical protein